MSLLGAWTKTPGRRGAAAAPRVAVAALEPRDDGRRDNVTLLYLLALDGISQDPHDGLVGIHGDDLPLAQVLGAGRGAVEEQLVADDQSVVGADADLQPLVGRIDLRHLAGDRRRVRQAPDLADIRR